MACKQFTSLNPTLNGFSEILESYKVEQQLRFPHGYVEVRSYLWSRPMEDVVSVEKDVIVLNMALTPRPAHTRIARLGRQSRIKAEDVGRLMVIMPGTSFRLSAPSGELRSIHCALSRRKFDESLGQQIDWDGCGRVMELSGPGSEIEGLLNRIYRELRQQLPGWQAAAEAYANALCVELGRRMRQGHPVEPQLRKGGLAPWHLRALRDRVLADAPAPRLAELAELCGMTERQLSRAFKAETGQTVGRFVDVSIMERAHNLLITTDISIGEVAASLGFASAASFAQAFRRMCGVQPSEIRQQKSGQTPNSGHFRVGRA
ncbi:MAG: helix-turn-helix domain-containing protein [Rhizomicrobium sp.]